MNKLVYKYKSGSAFGSFTLAPKNGLKLSEVVKKIKNILDGKFNETMIEGCIRRLDLVYLRSYLLLFTTLNSSISTKKLSELSHSSTAPEVVGLLHEIFHLVDSRLKDNKAFDSYEMDISKIFSLLGLKLSILDASSPTQEEKLLQIGCKVNLNSEGKLDSRTSTYLLSNEFSIVNYFSDNNSPLIIKHGDTVLAVYHFIEGRWSLAASRFHLDSTVVHSDVYLPATQLKEIEPSTLYQITRYYARFKSEAVKNKLNYSVLVDGLSKSFSNQLGSLLFSYPQVGIAIPPYQEFDPSDEA